MFQIPDWTLIAFSTETWPHLQEKWFILIASGLKIDTWEIQMAVERTNFSISAKGLIIYWLWLWPYGGDHRVTISAEEMRNFRIFFFELFRTLINKKSFYHIVSHLFELFVGVFTNTSSVWLYRAHVLNRPVQKDIFKISQRSPGHFNITFLQETQFIF